MKTLLLVLVVGVVLYLGYEAVRIVYLIEVSKKLVLAAKPYEQTVGTSSLLVLGDSTAVGVGSVDPSQTVAGRLGTYLHASVENYAVSGAVAADLVSQLMHAEKNHYDVILVQIGANDVIRMRSLSQTQETLSGIADTLSKRGSKVIYLTAGKIGDAPFFPSLFRPVLNQRASTLREGFMKIASEHEALYVDLYSAPISGFDTDPDTYYAPDGLHLTGAGYGLWFDELVQEASAKWPMVFHG